MADQTHVLELTIDGEPGGLRFPVRSVVLAGFSGRDRDSVRKHFDELRELGLEPPGRTPILFRVSDYLVRVEETVTVQDATTSGEVEFVLLIGPGTRWVTVGSDHTSRSMERHSIPASKQMYPKILAPTIWRFEEVSDHWDRLVLRAWADGEPYQDSPLEELLAPDSLIREIEARLGSIGEGCVLMSGTIPTLGGGMAYAKRFDFEIEDPVRGRKIRHGYDVRQLSD